MNVSEKIREYLAHPIGIDEDIREIMREHGEDIAKALDDWSYCVLPLHAPYSGEEFREMLKRLGFEVKR